MLKGIIGKKVGMTQVFSERGEVVPVTVIEAGPCTITQIRTEDRDGYRAVQLGFEETRPKRLTKAERGHLGIEVGKARQAQMGSSIRPKKLPPLRHLREIRTKDIEGLEVGQKVDVSIFQPGERVDVIGTSKGKGFAGVVKRHGFGGGPVTHGQSDRLRAPGSIGSGTTPGRVVKGLRMAGHMGTDRVTVHNLQVVQVDPERNLLLVRGAVPGASGGLLIVQKAAKQGK
jgi:large subunit ribosomal protein L3